MNFQNQFPYILLIETISPRKVDSATLLWLCKTTKRIVNKKEKHEQMVRYDFPTSVRVLGPLSDVKHSIMTSQHAIFITRLMISAAASFSPPKNCSELDVELSIRSSSCSFEP
jgi:hypothetical protein